MRIATLLSAALLLMSAAGAQANQAVQGAAPAMSMEIHVWRSDARFADEPDPEPRPRPGGISYGSWERWIMPADVPADLRARPLDTSTQLLLDIDAAGRASRCRIVARSSDPRLDALACELLPRRGTFEPAYIGPGRPTAGRWLMAVTWNVITAEARAEQIRNRPPAVAFPPRLPGSDSWPRLAWSQHVRPESLPSIQSDYPAAAHGREGTVSLELGLSPAEGITGCTVGVSAGDAALDEAACRVARTLVLRYTDPCGVCVGDSLPLQVVWRRHGSHIRLPLLRQSYARHPAPPMLRDPADARTATFYDSFPRALPFAFSPRDFRSLPMATLADRHPVADLAIDERGRVTGCSLRRSTGDAAVDARVCELLRAGQRYAPPTDVFGDPAPATAMRWLDLTGL